MQEIVVFNNFLTSFCDSFSGRKFPEFSQGLLNVEVHKHTQNIDREEPVVSVWGV